MSEDEPLRITKEQAEQWRSEIEGRAKADNPLVAYYTSGDAHRGTERHMRLQITVASNRWVGPDEKADIEGQRRYLNRLVFGRFINRIWQAVSQLREAGRPGDWVFYPDGRSGGRLGAPVGDLVEMAKEMEGAIVAEPVPADGNLPFYPQHDVYTDWRPFRSAADLGPGLFLIAYETAPGSEYDIRLVDTHRETSWATRAIAWHPVTMVPPSVMWEKRRLDSEDAFWREMGGAHYAK